MNIGIDIDDTIANTSEIVAEYYKKYNKRSIDNVNKGKKDIFNIHLLNNINKSMKDKFIKNNYCSMLKNVKIKNNASININKLKEEGNRIFFISSRWEDKNENVYRITSDWLESNNINFDYLYINVTHKSEIINHNNIQLFIDDNYNNCKDAKKKTNAIVYIMNSKANSKAQLDGITRVFDWDEIYRKIKTLNVKNK